jgi:hypothetical protein
MHFLYRLLLLICSVLDGCEIRAAYLAAIMKHIIGLIFQEDWPLQFPIRGIVRVKDGRETQTSISC